MRSRPQLIPLPLAVLRLREALDLRLETILHPRCKRKKNWNLGDVCASSGQLHVTCRYSFIRGGMLLEYKSVKSQAPRVPMIFDDLAHLFAKPKSHS